MIKIICVGKIKEKYLLDAINEYHKRITKYSNISIVEIPDYKTDIPKEAIKYESEKIIKQINKKDYIIALAIEGKEVSSIELSKMIEESQMISSTITFIIGGSCGLSDEIKSIANKVLSFSKLTFPHQLFRVLLLEQIYRAFKIINNESYHK